MIVDIEDTGEGIRKEKIGNLFVRDNDAGNEGVIKSNDSNGKSSGIGLAICSEILKEMNGEISVKSEYQAGSIFTFKIPQRFTSMETVAYIPNSSQLCALIFEKNNEYAEQVRKIMGQFGIANDIARTRQDLERFKPVILYVLDVVRYDLPVV